LRITHHRVRSFHSSARAKSQGKFWAQVKKEGALGEAFVYDAVQKKRLRGITNHLTTCAGGFGAAFVVSAAFTV
jgi:hypothetical protein